ncbi:LppU/SCO3897 family protein [Allorhizocola rhizosphaerae]|uniref:LppU/SCO3897 family protein n=1 Tax=Allorhizocola rhizosphaerae TaxID=1872709 RepID=UPI000E3C6210|nr:hypothetical protein [Allorhizocola rhizosphaerae]
MRKVLAVVGAILVVVCVVRVILGFVQSVDEVNRWDAAVGDCVAEDMTQEVRIVACDDPQARRRVVGREIRPTPATEQLVNEACAPYATAEDVFWRTLASDQVLILCLETVRR